LFHFWYCCIIYCVDTPIHYLLPFLLYLHCVVILLFNSCYSTLFITADAFYILLCSHCYYFVYILPSNPLLTFRAICIPDFILRWYIIWWRYFYCIIPMFIFHFHSLFCYFRWSISDPCLTTLHSSFVLRPINIPMHLLRRDNVVHFVLFWYFDTTHFVCLFLSTDTTTDSDDVSGVWYCCPVIPCIIIKLIYWLQYYDNDVKKWHCWWQPMIFNRPRLLALCCPASLLTWPIPARPVCVMTNIDVLCHPRRWLASITW